jgi:3-deoxy-7-phosphoheptulonate synthase
MKKTQDIHVSRVEPLISPKLMKSELPMTESVNKTVVGGRETIGRILDGSDPRLLVVVGPCSIHDENAALEYAGELRALAAELEGRILMVMRVYFEKPRTTIGWKGLINDPHLNGTFDISSGVKKGRHILLTINGLGLPTASEMLDPITPQYTSDLVAWASIGARTTESQTHRQMASGLSMPVGYKNGTDGNLQVAIDAMQSARHNHAFLGIDDDGRTCVIHTGGNPRGHLILRGGRSGPNYDSTSVADAVKRLEAAGLNSRLMIDCSHANSEKDFRNQGHVLRQVIAQRTAGTKEIMGVMLESNLNEGSQSMPDAPTNLRRGVSITDGCIGWEETVRLLREVHRQLAPSPPRT